MKFVALILVVFASALGFLMVVDFDTSESYFASYSEVARGGKIPDGGWLPSFLPPSATEIRDLHNIDTNEGWISFRFDPEDTSFTNEKCLLIDRSSVVLPRERRTKEIAWWVSNEKVGAGQYYSCGDSTFLLLDKQNSVAYYWVLAQ